MDPRYEKFRSLGLTDEQIKEMCHAEISHEYSEDMIISSKERNIRRRKARRDKMRRYEEET